MLREIFKDTLTDTRRPHLAYHATERYQIRCDVQEAITQLAEMQLRKNVKGHDPDIDNQISALGSVTAHILNRSGLSPRENTMNINGQLWEDPRGLSNRIIGYLDKEKIDWRAKSWITSLLTDKFDPQKQLESAAKLGFISEDVDSYVLRDALFRWKSP